MAKLDKQFAKQVDKTEVSSGSFEAIPEGTYFATMNRDVEERTSQNGNPYWSWEFQLFPGQGYDGRRFWTNTPLTGEYAPSFLKRMFAAFGATADTDTALLVGKPVKIRIVQKVIPYGQKAGEIGNEIKYVLPYDGDPESVPSAPGTGGFDDEIPF